MHGERPLYRPTRAQAIRPDPGRWLYGNIPETFRRSSIDAPADGSQSGLAHAKEALNVSWRREATNMGTIDIFTNLSGGQERMAAEGRPE